MFRRISASDSAPKVDFLCATGQLSLAWMTHTFRHRQAHENRPGFGCDQILMAHLHSTSAGSTAQGDRLLLLPGGGLGVRVVWVAGVRLVGLVVADGAARRGA
jgi:hypothetical protein